MLLVCLAFILKLSCVFLISISIRQYCNSCLESVIVAWVNTYILMICIMLGLSVFSILDYTGMITCFVIVIFLLLYYNLRHGNFKNVFSLPTIKKRDVLLWLFLVIIVVVVFIALSYRSFYFFDTTGDAISYELPRISLFAQYKSLFVFQPTQAINIFSNEWNGELNSLYYVVLTGYDQSSSFGNVEIWLFSMLIFTWISNIFNIKSNLSLLIAISIFFLPVSLMLSMTVKGDLLSFSALSLAVVWLIQFYRDRNNLVYLITCAGAIGLLSGSKIPMLPVSLLLFGVYLCIMIFGYVSKYRIRLLCLSMIIFLIGAARYVINMFILSNPVVRVSGEHPNFLMKNVALNFSGLYHSVIDVWYINPFKPYTELLWALSANLGYLGIILVIMPVLLYIDLFKKQYTPDKWMIFIIVCLIFPTFFILSSAIPWMPWSFRYFGPWMILLLLYCLISLGKYSEKFIWLKFIWFVILVIDVTNIFIYSHKSEVMPTSFAIAVQNTEIQRKLAFHPFLLGGGMLRGVPCLKDGGADVLIFNGIAAVIYPYFGPNHTNNVSFVDTSELFKEKIRNKSYDIVVISTSNYSMILDIDLRNQGYTRI